MKIFYNYANNATELEIKNNAELHNIVKIHGNYVRGILNVVICVLSNSTYTKICTLDMKIEIEVKTYLISFWPVVNFNWFE